MVYSCWQPKRKTEDAKTCEMFNKSKEKIMGEREPVKKGGNQTIVQEANKQRKQYFHIWN